MNHFVPHREIRGAVVSILLAFVVFISFSPTLRNGFTGYDDPDYVTANPHVNSGLTGPNIAWAFTAAHSSNWHPLTWLSHALDCTMFGLDPAGHHLTSLLLHIANTLMLFLWLSCVTGGVWRSAFVAAMFGLHPLHVESVAWVAERKDVLSTLFWILTLIAYTAYVRKPSAMRYSLVAASLAAGLMSKPMLVTVPVLLLVLDWWPLKRKDSLSRLVREKVPLLALAAAAGAVTIWAQRGAGSAPSFDQLPLSLRLENAAVAYMTYLWKTVWPVNLAVFYPFPAAGIAWWRVSASVILLAAVSALVMAARGSHPWLTVGWCWYMLTLLPVIGIVQVGMQSMADRYMYVPMTGLLIALAWEFNLMWRRPLTCSGGCRAGVSSLLLAVCAILTWRQTQVWKDGATLFAHALEVTDDNFVAQDNLGVELDRRGQADEALSHYRDALRIRPEDRNAQANYAQANFAKGARLFDAGNLTESLALFHEGLQIRPRNPLAHTYVGLILTQQHQITQALAEFRQAIAIDPTLARAHMGMGVALAWSGQAVEARSAFEATLRNDPSNVEAHYDLGLVLSSLGANLAAINSFDVALRLKPDFEAARQARAEALRHLAGVKAH